MRDSDGVLLAETEPNGAQAENEEEEDEEEEEELEPEDEAEDSHSEEHVMSWAKESMSDPPSNVGSNGKGITIDASIPASAATARIVVCV